MQQTIQNLLSQARLDDINNTLPTLNSSTSSTSSTDRPILRSSSENLHLTPHNLHLYEEIDEDFDTNVVHNLFRDRKKCRL